jgi:hypothetical protein
MAGETWADHVQWVSTRVHGLPLPINPAQGEGGAAVTLIFLDLQVRQPVRVFRCVFRAEGFIFMPSMVAEDSVPSRDVERETPEVVGKAGQLPAFESES